MRPSLIITAVENDVSTSFCADPAFIRVDPAMASGPVFNATRTSGGNSKVVALLGYVHARQGREAEARQVLDTLLAVACERYVPPCAIALVHLGLGDVDSAAHFIERAYDARDVHLMFVPVDAKWDEARADPRIAAVLRRCGFTAAA